MSTSRTRKERTHDHLNQVKVDVVLLGGGLAGLTLARQLKLAYPDIAIMIVEKNKHPVTEAAFKVGESTVELGTFYLREVLDLKSNLDSRQLPKAGLRYFFSFGDNKDIRRRLEVGLTDLPPVPSHQLDRGRFENELGTLNKEQGILFWDDCKVRKVALGQGDDLHNVTVQHQGQQRVILTRWIVDATGRTAFLKRRLMLAEAVDHVAHAAWFRINDVIDVADWVNDKAWLHRTAKGIRRLSTNHLMGPGYWVWLIPLVSGQTSVGIVVDGHLHPMSRLNRFEKALAWLQEYEPECARVIEEKQEALLDFRALQKYSHSCKHVFSAERWALTGEAGVFLDPFYSPGTDFIAISNTFIKELIVADLSGENIEVRAAHYNRIYMTLFKEFLALFEGQYPLMGNPTVFLPKIVWDWAVYWGVIALLFFNDKVSDLSFAARIGQDLQAVTQLNINMQKFFQKWGTLKSGVLADNFVNLMSIGFLHTLHCNLEKGLTDEVLVQRVRQNIELIGAAAEAIVQKGCSEHPALEPERQAVKTVLSQLRLTVPATEVAQDLQKIWLETQPVPAV